MLILWIYICDNLPQYIIIYNKANMTIFLAPFLPKNKPQTDMRRGEKDSKCE